MYIIYIVTHVRRHTFSECDLYFRGVGEVAIVSHGEQEVKVSWRADNLINVEPRHSEV